ncbi:MAG: damage-inducible protein DinB [Gemmatimonadetes bacterium]|nr:damage-inducible protein DinB [Gemmatimonadota bacterium]
MRPALERLSAHMRWADAKALEALRAARPVPPLALEIYSHILGAEAIWLARLEGRGVSVAVWPGLTLEQCGTLAAETASGFERLIRDVADARFDEPVTYRNTNGDEFSSLRSDILLHVFLHGAYHRGQVASLLRSGGAEPQPTDYIAMRRGAPAARTPR